MSSLVVCPDCTRHIRRTEKACPFCRTTVTAKLAQTPERPMPTERLNRSALFAFAAAGIGAIACGGSVSRDDSKTILESGSGGGLAADGPGGTAGGGGYLDHGNGGALYGAGGGPIPSGYGKGGTAGGGGYLDHGNGGALYGAGGIPLGYGQGGTAGSGGRDAGSVAGAGGTADAGEADGAVAPDGSPRS